MVWVLQTRYFAFRGYSVLAVDLPGHGLSSGESLKTIEEMGNWVGDVIGAVGCKEASLVGHSQGCLVTMECVAQHPEKIKTLTLMGGASAIPMNPELLKLAEESNPKAVDLMMDFAHGPAGHFGGHPVPGLYHLNVGSMIVQNKEIKDTLDKNGISRRDFIKTAGAGASLVIAKMLGFGDEFTKAAKVVRPTVEQTATGGVPPYFFELVKKIKKSGRTIEAEYDPRVENNMVFENYIMRENKSTGEISIQKTKEGMVDTGSDYLDGTISEETITYKPGEDVIGTDGKTYRTPDEYEEFTTKPDINDMGKMKDVEPGLDSIEEIIELMPNQLKMSDLEKAGYNVEAFPDNIKQLLIDDLQKID